MSFVIGLFISVCDWYCVGFIVDGVLINKKFFSDIAIVTIWNVL